MKAPEIRTFPKFHQTPEGQRILAERARLSDEREQLNKTSIPELLDLHGKLEKQILDAEVDERFGKGTGLANLREQHAEVEKKLTEHQANRRKAELRLERMAQIVADAERAYAASIEPEVLGQLREVTEWAAEPLIEAARRQAIVWEAVRESQRHGLGTRGALYDGLTFSESEGRPTRFSVWLRNVRKLLGAKLPDGIDRSLNVAFSMHGQHQDDADLVNAGARFFDETVHQPARREAMRFADRVQAVMDRLF